MQDLDHLVIVISGPSGSGKTSVIERLLSIDPKLSVAISVTTRPQRPGEEHGKDYYFMDNDTFNQRLKNDEFAEHATIYGNQYGTLKSEIQRLSQAGCDIVFNKDYQGMCGLQNHYNVVSIFLAPPSLEALRQRLVSRNQDTEDVIEQRLVVAIEEMTHAQNYQYVVANDDFETCVQAVYDIISKERIAPKSHVPT